MLSDFRGSTIRQKKVPESCIISALEIPRGYTKEVFSDNY
jgi:hypothetical protein